MIKPESFPVRPGTLVLIFMIAGVGIGMFSWSSSYFETAGEHSGVKQENLVKCSELNIETVNKNMKEGTTSILFKSNKEVRKVYISFIGDQNRTKTVEDVSKGSLYRVEADLSNPSDIYLKAEDCSKIFRS